MRWRQDAKLTGMTRRFLFATSHSYLPERVGGSEISTHELVRALSSLGHDASVLCTSSNIHPAYVSRIRSDRDLGYNVFRHENPSEVILDVARDLNVDWVVVSADRPLYEVVCATKRRAAIFFRDVEFDRHAWRLREIENAVYLANSRFVAARVKALFGIDATVIYPIVRIERYSVVRQGADVLFFNPTGKKGIELALGLAKARPDIVFHFVETWPLSSAQSGHYKGRALSLPNVVWHSAELDTRRFYRTARILIVPSIWEEAWGRVVIEAQASGIPVVASDRGGLPESVGEGGLVIRDFQEPRAWLDAIAFLDDPDNYERFSMAARANARRVELRPHRLAKAFLEALGSSS